MASNLDFNGPEFYKLLNALVEDPAFCKYLDELVKDPKFLETLHASIGKIKCYYCETLNSVGQERCSKCNRLNVANRWACKVCTFAGNLKEFVECSCCDTPRQ
jgi:hypothetical protein